MIDRTAEWGMVSVIGPAAADAIPGAHPDALHEHVALDGARLVRTEHGFDIVGPQAAVDAITRELTASGVAAVGPVAYDAFRIDTGIPLQPFDIDERTIPQEAFLELEAVSFTKGCFLGQELVCRIDSRGHVNRFLRHITGIDGEWPVPGTEIVVDGQGRGRDHECRPARAGRRRARLRAPRSRARHRRGAALRDGDGTRVGHCDRDGGSCGRIVIVIPDCTTMPVSASVVPTPELVSTLTF